MNNVPTDFHKTMRGLERGLTVTEIATFDLHTCNVTDSVPAVSVKFQPMGIDYLPVIDKGRIVGVLTLTGIADDAELPKIMKPLSEDMLVSSNDPILEVIALLKESHYRLVVQHGKIMGIVTISDLHKLPVRVLAFTQVSHLEMLMSAIISRYCDEQDEWTSHISETRLASAKNKQQFLKSDRLDPPLLECTDFCDKRDIVRRLLKLPGSFERDLKSVERLRNQVAHAAGLGDGPSASKYFISSLMLTSEWITRLKSHLE